MKPFRPMDSVFLAIFTAALSLTGGCHFHFAESHKHYHGSNIEQAEAMDAGQPDELEERFNATRNKTKALGVSGKP